MKDLRVLQGYLAHKKTRNSQGPPKDPRHGLTVGSCGVAVSYERDSPVRRQPAAAARHAKRRENLY